MHHSLLPDLPMYLGFIFEQVCREFVQQRAGSLWPGEVAVQVELGLALGLDLGELGLVASLVLDLLQM